VLIAMGAGPDLARGLVRVSLGRGNTEQDVDGFMDTLTRQLAALPRRAAG
jgi:cysteine sulfinate desulfinase/cysteine desulfurase-like protein